MDVIAPINARIVDQKTRDLRLIAWRWHLLAALIVVPFVLWQSLTGTLYLWSQTWIDTKYSELRFVAPVVDRVSVDAQLQAARNTLPGSRIASVLIPADPERSTQVIFMDSSGLPVAAFIDPYRGNLLGVLREGAWVPGWSRSLHGGWPLGAAGSWLLELGACWTIVTVLSGLYLWWPRDRRPLAQVLVPRLNVGKRVFWRDLHACVAVWFSAAILLFLLTALPWTSLWGMQILDRVQHALGQDAPPAAGFAPVFGNSSGAAGAASLDVMVKNARAAGIGGDILLSMVDGPPGSAVSLRSSHPRSSTERYMLFDRADGTRLAAADWNDFPFMAKGIATGVDLHEGNFFGRAGPWVNTLFAAALVWLSVTGIAAWWTRRPKTSTSLPPPTSSPWPTWLVVSIFSLAVFLPLFGASLLLLWIAERGWRFVASKGAL